MPLDPLKRPPWPRVFRGLLLGIPAVVLLIVTILPLNCLQILLWPVGLFSPSGYHRFLRWSADSWWGLCIALSRGLHGVEVIYSGDEIETGENAIVFANHQQMTDILFLFFAARRGQRLGDLKWFVKDIIKYVPGVGWGLLFLDNLFVKRRWAEDARKIDGTFSRLTRSGKPFWVVIFAEGTRITPKKLARSRSIQRRKKDLQVLDHVMMPRTKGFSVSVMALREHLDAVYDLTIGYEDGVPSLWQYVQGFVPRAHIHVSRFAAGDIPSSEAELSAWLNRRFEAKDALLASFYEDGAFSNP